MLDPNAIGQFTPDGCWMKVLTRTRADSPQRALFMDRDGVLMEERCYLADPKGVVLIDGATDTVRAARKLGMRTAIVTNQSGIGRGLFGWEEYWAVEESLLTLLAAEDALPDAIFACPHHPDGIGAYRQAHPWRKPGPGMFFAAAHVLNLDLTESMMIGDKGSDATAACAAGLGRTVHVMTGHGASEHDALRKLVASWPSTAFDGPKTEIKWVHSIADVQTDLLKPVPYTATTKLQGTEP